MGRLICKTNAIPHFTVCEVTYNLYCSLEQSRDGMIVYFHMLRRYTLKVWMHYISFKKSLVLSIEVDKETKISVSGVFMS